MRRTPLLALLLVLTLAAAAQTSGELVPYRIDPAHSAVGFVVRHFTVSKVRGGFDKFSGNFLVDEKDLTRSQFDVTIQAASVNTRVENRDNDLRSPNFFDVANYPEITFKSKRIEKTADGYLATGDLTIHGVTKEIPLAFTLIGPIKDPRGGSRYGVEAGATINRQDFGVSWSRVLEGGGLVVDNSVAIEINAELVKINPEAAPSGRAPGASPPPPPK